MGQLDPLQRLVELIGRARPIGPRPRRQRAIERRLRAFAPLGGPAADSIRVYRFVNEHFQRPLGCDRRRPRWLHMAASTFSRFFHRTAGKPFTAYVNRAADRLRPAGC